MTTNAAHTIAANIVAKLVPGGAPALAQLSDDELLANTRRLVGKSNQLLAALLVHLAEVEARGVHRTRRCASLYTYCIYELRFSEDAAARRSAAARFTKQFPALLDAIADGELHLTGLLMIGPHLTLENHLEVLGRAKFRTKKELGKLIRDLNPLPGLPDCVQPLGPQPPRALRTPSWAEYVESLSPAVRELPQGERPRDWVNDGIEGFGTTHVGVNVEATRDEALPVGPVPADLPPITKPQQYQVQFSTSEEHAQLIERAKALVARTRPTITLGELHLEAMKVLVASLEKRKFAVGTRPRSHSPVVTPQPNALAGNEPPRQSVINESPQASHRGEPPRQSVINESPQASDHREPPRQRVIGECPRRTDRVDVQPNTRGAKPLPKRSRHIPAAALRAVYGRDGGRCTSVDARGERCHETRGLEIHHLEAFARGGAHEVWNLTLRCHAHNDLAAEEDFGRELMAGRRDSARHESVARQLRPDTLRIRRE